MTGAALRTPAQAPSRHGRRPISWPLRPLSFVTGDDLTEGAGLKMKISFNRQAPLAANTGEFGKQEITPFFLEAANVTEEYEIAILRLAFGDEPCPVRIRR